MMKKFNSILFALFLVLLTFGCSVGDNPIYEESTSLIIRLPGKTAARKTYSREDIESYTVTLSNESGYREEKTNILPGGECSFVDLTAGTYTVEVKGYNSDKELVAEGSENAQVVAGETSTVKILIKLLDVPDKEPVNDSDKDPINDPDKDPINDPDKDSVNDLGISLIKVLPDFDIVSEDIEADSEIILSDKKYSFNVKTKNELESFDEFTNFFWKLNGYDIGVTSPGENENFVLSLYEVDAYVNISGENLLTCVAKNGDIVNSASFNFKIKSDFQLTFKNDITTYFDSDYKYYNKDGNIERPVISGTDFPLGEVSKVTYRNFGTDNNFWVLAGWKDTNDVIHYPDENYRVTGNETFEPVWNLFKDEIDVQQAKNGRIVLFDGKYEMNPYTINNPHTINGNLTISAYKDCEAYIICKDNATDKGGMFQIYNNDEECSLTLNTESDCGTLIIQGMDEKSTGAILNVQKGGICRANKGVVLEGGRTVAGSSAAGINIENGTVYLKDMIIRNCASADENSGVINQNGNLYLEGNIEIDTDESSVDADSEYRYKSFWCYKPITLSGVVNPENRIYLSVPDSVLKDGMQIIKVVEDGDPDWIWNSYGIMLSDHHPDWHIDDNGVLVYDGE